MTIKRHVFLFVAQNYPFKRQEPRQVVTLCVPLAGLEPALCGLEVRRIIHYATGANEVVL